ncbi:MAG: hypothetical protein ABR529_10795 [Actinomycetota bacterium]
MAPPGRGAAGIGFPAGAEARRAVVPLAHRRLGAAPHVHHLSRAGIARRHRGGDDVVPYTKSRVCVSSP